MRKCCGRISFIHARPCQVTCEAYLRLRITPDDPRAQSTSGTLVACIPCLSVFDCMLPAGYLRLWDASNDPWSDTTDSLALLNELTSYWNTNMRAQKRTVVYMARRVYCLALGLGRRGGGRSWLPSY